MGCGFVCKVAEGGDVSADGGVVIGNVLGVCECVEPLILRLRGTGGVEGWLLLLFD